MRRTGGILVVLASLAAGCGRDVPPPKEYQLKGQIISVKPENLEVLVKHEDIPGFKPAMTMPYQVKDAAVLTGTQPGDLITATLLVGEVEAHLSTITRTGSAPIEDPSAGPAITAADLVEPGEPVPGTALVDQDGAPRPLSSLRGHRVALTFTYTRCPMADFCPLMDRHFTEVQKAIKATPALADVRLVSVTLDPEFDTPAVLKRHAQALKADPAIWHFVTGNRDDLASLAKSFAITTEPGDASNILVHNLRTAVIDPDGRLVKVESGNSWTPAELIADLKAAPAPPR